jgi:dipeptidase
MTRLIFLAALALLLPPATRACTAVIAGAKASADGSVLVTHSDDGEGNSDARLGFVPAANHSAGAMRPVWPDLESFPRYVGSARGDTYLRQPGQTDTVPIGYIPEVPHTYAYFEANYGIQNEHQLSIGESTCSAVFGSAAIGQVNGTALLNVNELSRLALERTTNARDAIRTMGDLASRYGFYGPGTFEGTGETLLVGDPSEGFVFHILPDDTGRSAVWVAQRVPDDEVTVVANMFTIREVNCDDEQNYLCSPNLHSLAIKHNLWDGQGQLDFVRAYSDGEYAHQYYSGRRMWRALDIFAPCDPLHMRLRTAATSPRCTVSSSRTDTS